MRHGATYVAVGLTVMIGLAAATARAGDDPRELEGRALFAKGSYQQALDVFAMLFAEKADPVYLRNIGRCHQKLRNPDQAIDAFQEYLRRSRPKAAEQEEIAGFIREMEELKKTGKAETKASTRTGEGRADARPPPPLGSPAGESASEPPRLVQRAGPPPGPESAGAPAKPLTRQWWFWAAIGAVVVGAAVTAVALGTQGSASPPPCPSGFACPR